MDIFGIPETDWNHNEDQTRLFKENIVFHAFEIVQLADPICTGNTNWRTKGPTMQDARGREGWDGAAAGGEQWDTRRDTQIYSLFYGPFGQPERNKFKYLCVFGSFVMFLLLWEHKKVPRWHTDQFSHRRCPTSLPGNRQNDMYEMFIKLVN